MTYRLTILRMQTTAGIPRPVASPAHLRDRALTKARVYWSTVLVGCNAFCDFYSFDKSGRYEVADPRTYGLRGLQKMIDGMGAKVARAIIYDNQAPNRPEIMRKERGSWNG